MKLLVLASDPVDAATIRDAMGDEAEGAEVRVLSPAVNSSSLAFWVSDADEAIADADAVHAETVGALHDDGVRAEGETGDSDALTAIADTLATFPADRLLVFVRGGEEEQRYKEKDVIGEAERRFSLPVQVVTR